MSEIIEQTRNAIGQIKEILSFSDLVKIWKGTQDITERAKIILDPVKPQTSTNLSSSQVDFIAISKSITDFFPEFVGLEKFADQFLLSSMSKDGFGVNSVIQYEQATSEKRLMQLGMKAEKTQDVK